MAINNWGGVKEHMSKRPRKVFSNKRISKNTKYKHWKIPLRTNTSKADAIRRKKVRRLLLVYMMIALIGVLLFLFFR